MGQFIVWADGRKDEARKIEAADMPAAIEEAATLFDVSEDAVRIIGESVNGGDNVGAAEYHGVSHAL